MRLCRDGGDDAVIDDVASMMWIMINVYAIVYALLHKSLNMISEQSITDSRLLKADNMASKRSNSMDCDTPTVSELENYGWSAKDLQTLMNHFHYYSEMKYFILSDIRDGPDVNMPKQPKPNLKSVLVKQKQNLLGLELNEYLKKHLVDYEVVDLDPWDPKSLDSVKNSLKKIHLVKQNNAKVFSH